MRFFRPCWLLVLFFSATLANPQPPAPTTLAGIAHVALRVSDLTRSSNFYQKLGFEQSFAFTKDGVTTEVFLKVNDRQFLEMYPQQQPPQEIGFMHVCFESTDLEQLNRAYQSRDLSPTPVKRAGAGNLLFTMEGPEHQNIEYTQYMPGSLHSNDRGKHLGEDRVADRMVSVSLAMQDTAAARDFYIKQLIFKPIAGESMFLYMPGDSGQKVEIAPTSLGARARIILDAKSLSEADRLLQRQRVTVAKVKGALAVTDPDGNIILIEARR
jgi:catechol 2,3-dioxygenase-like lactoylglutathione lyase family enzyme